MSTPGVVYRVSPAVPNDANPSILFPGGQVPYGYSTNDQYAWDVMSGYSSGTLLEDVGGAFGTMIYGTGGHTRIQNQILKFDLSANSPTFGWYQQPYFETSEVNGANLYWNPSEFAALAANRKMSNGGGTESTLSAAWLAGGAGFPCGCEGWIFPRKMTTGQLGNNNPHGFRFATTTYVPPSMTGTGSGGITVAEGPQGPFSQGWLPSGAGVVAADMMNTSHLYSGSGRRKSIAWHKNTTTGAWSQIGGFQPDYSIYGFVAQHTAVARDQRKVYVSADESGGAAVTWSIDYSAGLAGATCSALVRPVSGASSPSRYSTGAFTDGHPDGRHLWYWMDLVGQSGGYMVRLVVQDLDANTSYSLAVTGLAVPNSEQCGMSYDAARNRLLIVYMDGTTLKYATVHLPSVPTNAAGYVVTTYTPTFDSSTAGTKSYAHFYGKTRYHAGLNCILVPQSLGPMLAFEPLT